MDKLCYEFLLCYQLPRLSKKKKKKSGASATWCVGIAWYHHQDFHSHFHALTVILPSFTRLYLRFFTKENALCLRVLTTNHHFIRLLLSLNGALTKVTRVQPTLRHVPGACVYCRKKTEIDLPPTLPASMFSGPSSTLNSRGKCIGFLLLDFDHTVWSCLQFWTQHVPQIRLLNNSCNELAMNFCRYLTTYIWRNYWIVFITISSKTRFFTVIIYYWIFNLFETKLWSQGRM